MQLFMCDEYGTEVTQRVGNKKSILSLDMEKMVDCRVAVGISEMLNLKELKSEVMHECLTLVLAALEPTQIGCMKLK